MQKDNTSQVLYLLVCALGVPITRQSIENETAKHPEHNSLLAISELLNYWRTPNAAYNLSFEELAQVPLPFIAFFSKREFLLVTQLTDKHAIVSNERWKKRLMSINDFEKGYSGSILIAEKDETSGESDYANKHKKELLYSFRAPAVLTASIILMLLSLRLNSG